MEVRNEDNNGTDNQVPLVSLPSATQSTIEMGRWTVDDGTLDLGNWETGERGSRSD